MKPCHSAVTSFPEEPAACPQIHNLACNTACFPSPNTVKSSNCFVRPKLYPEKWKPQVPIYQAALCHIPAELYLYSDSLKYHSVAMTSSYRMFGAMVTVSNVERLNTVDSVTVFSDKETHYYCLTNTSRGYLR